MPMTPKRREPSRPDRQRPRRRGCRDLMASPTRCRPPSACAPGAGSPGAVRNVVLVHGGPRRRSSWSEVIERPACADVTADRGAEPADLVADDAAATRLILARHAKPTILEGSLHGATSISRGAPTLTSSAWSTSRPGRRRRRGLRRRSPDLPRPRGHAGLVYRGRVQGEPHRAPRSCTTSPTASTETGRGCSRRPRAYLGHLFADRSATAWRSKPSWYADPNAIDHHLARA